MKNTIPRLGPLTMLALLVGAAPCAAAAPFRGPPCDPPSAQYEPDPSDTRYDAVGGLTRYDLGGSPNVYCTATLIAPGLVLAAGHCASSNWWAIGNDWPPPYYNLIRFRRNTSGGFGCPDHPEEFHHVRVERWLFPAPGNYAVPGFTDDDSYTEMMIGVLETPVTHIEPMPVVHNRVPRVLYPSQSELTNIPAQNGGWGPSVVTPYSGDDIALRVVDCTGSTSGLRLYMGGCAVPLDSGSALLYEDRWGNVRLVGVTGSNMIQAIADSPGVPRLPTQSLREAHLDLDRNTLIEHADYLMFMAAFLDTTTDFERLDADYNDNGEIDILDRVEYLQAALEYAGSDAYCRLDVDLNGEKNSYDISAILTYFYSSDPRGDFDLNGVVDMTDVNAMVAAYSTETCP